MALSFLRFVCPLLLFSFSAQASDTPRTSLFFTQDEQRAIDKLNHPTEPTAPPSHLTLGAVMYYGPRDWSVWLQGERWTPDTPDHGDLHIVSVTPDTVRVAYHLTTTQHQVELHPNQTLALAP